MLRYFKPPSFDELDHNERSSVVFYSIWLLIAGSALGGFFGRLQIPSAFSLHMLPMAYTIPPIGLMCLELNRRGFDRLAAWMFLSAYLALAFLRVPYLGGIYSPTISLFPMMALFAGVTLGTRVGVAIAIVSAGLTFSLLRIDPSGAAETFKTPPYGAWTSLCICIVYGLFLSRVSLNQTAKALRAARAELASRRAAERKLSLALETGSVGAYEATLDGDWFIGDSQALKIMGFEDGPVRGLSREALHALIHPEDLPRLTEANESLRQGAQSFRVEVRRLGADGDHYIEIASTVLLEDRGARSQVGTITDLSDRREAEAERRRLEARLRSAEQMRAIGSMARGIAHDFNNILGAVQGFSQLLEEDLPPNSPEHGFAVRISDTVNHGKAVIDQILSLAKSEAEGSAIVDVGELVQRLAALLESLLGPRLVLKMEPCSSGLWCNINTGQVTQVLCNLCKNASDAVGDHHGQVSIRVKRLTATLRAEFVRDVRRGTAYITGVLDREADYLVIRVADNGPGIPQERMGHVFEPFYTSKGAGRGTGLGLAVVRSVAQGHDGVCVVQTELGRGSTFSVILPFAMPPMPAEVPPSGRKAPHRQSPP
jgi:PAS domain S-box-containing protein